MIVIRSIRVNTCDICIFTIRLFCTFVVRLERSKQFNIEVTSCLKPHKISFIPYSVKLLEYSCIPITTFINAVSIPFVDHVFEHLFEHVIQCRNSINGTNSSAPDVHFDNQFLFNSRPKY